MSEYPDRGWLPVQTEIQLRPTLIPKANVRWMEFGDTPLTDPFMVHTMQRLREQVPPAREITTDLDTVLRTAAASAPVRPSGLIFHVSRCGSTLLANALRTAEGVSVVSEPLAANHLFYPSHGETSAYLKARWDGRRRQALEAMFSLFARYKTGEPEKLLVKLPSICTLGIEAARKWWPEVPFLMIVRDPVEVIVANLPGGGFMELQKDPPRAAQLFGWDITGMSPEVYAAHVQGDFCRAARQAFDAAHDRSKCKVMDYADLNSEGILEASAFLGIQPRRFERVMGSYSKDPTGQAGFRDDRKEKHRRASKAVLDAAEQWAQQPYRELRMWR